MRAVERARDGDQPPFIISTGRNEALHLQQGAHARGARGAHRRPDRAHGPGSPADADDAGIERDEIEDVVLVGGMTRMPRVRAAVAVLRREPVQGRSPRRGGRARRRHPGRGALDEQASDMVLLDVTPHALGIMIVGGYFRGADPEHDGPTSAPRASPRPATTRRR